MKLAQATPVTPAPVTAPVPAPSGGALPGTPAATTSPNGFDTFLSKVETQIIDPIIICLGLAAFILFAFGVFEFIRGADNDEKRKLGQQHMIYGLIGLMIMFGAGTIVAIMKKVVGG